MDELSTLRVIEAYKIDSFWKDEEKKEEEEEGLDRKELRSGRGKQKFGGLLADFVYSARCQ